MTVTDRLVPVGGAERLAATIPSRLDPDRFRASVCVTRGNPADADDALLGDVTERLESAGVRVFTLPRGGRVSPRAWRRFYGLLGDEQVDVLHAHKFGANVWGAAFGHLARVPAVVAHEHTWSFEGQRMRRFLDREVVARFSDVVLTVSRADERRMIEVEGLKRQKVRFVANGIEGFIADEDGPRRFRAEMGLGDGTAVIGTACAMREQKRLDVMIRAAALVAEEHDDVKLVLIGDGPERPRLEALVDSLGLQGTVLFAGTRPDVRSILPTLDVALLSSDFEGSPLALMEYMDARLPIVATAVGGVPDLIDDGVNGLLVPPGDETALANAALGLIRDPGRSAALGAAAAERRRTEFDIATMVSELEDLYVSLLP